MPYTNRPLHYLLAIVFIFSFRLYSQEVLVSQSYSSLDMIMNFQQGGFFTVDDPNISGVGFVTDNPKIFLRLHNDVLTPYSSDFRTTVKLSVTPRLWDGSYGSSTTVSLVVEYNPYGNSYDFKDVSLYEILNRYGAKVSVLSYQTEFLSSSTISNTIMSSTSLEIGFQADRYFALDVNASPSILLANAVSEPDEYGVNVPVAFDLTWSSVPGALSYELEWTWVDCYSNTDVYTPLSAGSVLFSDRDFELDNTRVRLDQVRYTIPMIYSRGFLIYRVRAVGRFQEDISKECFGSWSSDSSVSKVYVSDWTGSYTSILSHDDTKNWQFTANYAEDGLRKDAVGYYDGTLRNRQSVVTNNTDNTVVVGESFYDNQGRAVIQTLPVPVYSHPYLRYFNDFNRNLNEVKFSHYDFDWELEGAQCIALLSGMSSSSGSSNYYSPENAFTDNLYMHNRIPRSFNYPFSQIEYTPDNTGRVKRQGGVGSQYQLDGSHETRYFYSVPFQEELNRLFGYEVGWSSHYKKTIVSDANGQVSVSYIDPQGRTIATALSGDTPSNMGSLLDEQDSSLHQLMSVDLLNNAPSYVDSALDNNNLESSNAFGVQHDRLVYSRALGVSGNNVHYNFSYDIDQGNAFEACPGYYPYVYDLTISLKDDCGEDVISPTTALLGVEDAGGSNSGFSESYGPSTVLSTGNYTLYKELSVNSEVLTHYADYYESLLRDPSSSCYIDPSIFSPVLDINCDLSCSECMEYIGSKSDYILKQLKGYYNLSDSDNSSLSINSSSLSVSIGSGAVDILGNAIVQSVVDGQVLQFGSDWELLYSTCSGLCRPTFSSSCNFMERMLLKDVSPLGQYGALSADLVLDDTQGDPFLISVFNDSNELVYNNEILNNDWRHPFTPYVGQDGQASLIEIALEDDGVSYSPDVVSGANIIDQDGVLYVVPQDLSNVSDFQDRWLDSWASSLLEYHPEFCYLEYTRQLCDLTQAFTITNYDNTSSTVMLNSDEYDGYLNYIDTYTEAVQAGLFSLSNNLATFNNDPYFGFLSGYETNDLFDFRKGIMLTALNSQYENYTISSQNTTGITMLQTAYKLINCNALQTCEITSFNYNSLSSEDKDRLWNTYKSLYISLKSRIRHVFINVYAKSQGCYNGCIGDLGSANITSVISYYPQQSDIDDYISLNNPTPASPVVVPFCENTYAVNYQYSSKRFVPIDFSMDYQQDGQSTIDQLTALGSYEYYLQTGNCPRIEDMDLFLNHFFEEFNTNVSLTSLNNTDHGVDQYFTANLFEDFTGLSTPIADSPTPLIHTSISGSSLIFSFSPSGYISGPSALVVNLPSTVFTTGLSWSNYGLTNSWHIIGFTQLYYNSQTSDFSDANNPVFGFSVIARVVKGNDIADVILSGTTRAKIGECSLSDPSGVGEYLNPAASSDCEQKDYFASALEELVLNLQQSNSVNSTVNLMNNSIFNPQPYSATATSSFLRYYFGVDSSDQVVWSASSGVYTITINNVSRFVFNPGGNLQYALNIEFESYVPNTINWPVSVTYSISSGSESSFGYASGGGYPLYLVCCSPCGQWDHNGNGIGDLCESGEPGGTDDPYIIECSDLASAVNESRCIFIMDVEIDNVVGNAGVNYDADNLPDRFQIFYMNVGDAVGAENLLTPDNDTGYVCNYFDSSITSPSSSNYQLASTKLLQPDFPSSSNTSMTYMVKKYNSVTQQWDDTGLTETFSVNSSDINTTSGSASGDVTMSVDGSKNMMRVKVIGGSPSTVWSITSFICPGENPYKLTSTESSLVSGPVYESPVCVCIPQPVAPVACEEKYEEFLSFLAFDSGGASAMIDNLDYNEIPSLEDFYNGSLQYLVESYIYYISELGVSSTYDENYLSLAQFGNTELHYGYLYITDAIDSYSDYYNLYSGYDDHYLWNDYIDTIYISTAECPPSAMPVYSPSFDLGNPCEEAFATLSSTYTDNSYNNYIAYLRENFIKDYISSALSTVKERFSAAYEDKEYQYTLYYYDQGGNLIRTVAPEGVHRFESSVLSGLTPAINDHRSFAQPILNVAEEPALVPQHDFQTEYKYNSLNQLVWQSSPDGGVTRFAYDSLGRIIASQNEKQGQGQAPAYTTYMSYTEYDGLGRVVESGEVGLNTHPVGIGTYYINDRGRLVNVIGSIETLVDGFDSSSYKREVTRSIYDYPVSMEAGVLSSTLFESDYNEFTAKNRVTGVLYYDEFDALSPESFDNAIFYNYDVHGNVKEVVDYYGYLKEGSCDLALVLSLTTGYTNDCQAYLKRTQYDYDLISGSVKEVVFQKGKSDQFMYRYQYDADNRIVSALSSSNGSLWEQDANYSYYPHGPLARIELGDKKVQGIDYTYTLQGWIKSVNGDANEDRKFDPGLDGQEPSLINRDAFGYALTYNAHDYQSISNDDDGSYNYLPLYNSRKYEDGSDLYNGNIKQMTNQMLDTDEHLLASQVNTYSYDQLNRLKEMRSIAVSPGDISEESYSSYYDYDRNGNLQKLVRNVYNPGGAPVSMDGFEYDYTSGTNRLNIVRDGINGPSQAIDYPDDIEDQVNGLYQEFGISYNPSDVNTHNYVYNAVGQLIEDKTEHLTIDWFASGKVKKISKSDTGQDIWFDYNGLGNRIGKRIVKGDLEEVYHYALDATGNVMAVYLIKTQVVDGKRNMSMYVNEHYLYGSSRIGSERSAAEVYRNNTGIGDDPLTPGVRSTNSYSNSVGDKRYELTNHLGNVLVVINDKKLPVDPGSFVYFNPDVLSYQDYYPFGMIQPARNGSADSEGYRYGFQGQEKDNEIKGEGNSLNYKYRMHDPRVGRFFAIDPLTAKYPWYTPYSFSGNKLIAFIELEGLEEATTKNVNSSFGGLTIDFNKKHADIKVNFGVSYGTTAATVSYDLKTNDLKTNAYYIPSFNLNPSMSFNGKMHSTELKTKEYGIGFNYSVNLRQQGSGAFKVGFVKKDIRSTMNLPISGMEITGATDANYLLNSKVADFRAMGINFDKDAIKVFGNSLTIQVFGKKVEKTTKTDTAEERTDNAPKKESSTDIKMLNLIFVPLKNGVEGLREGQEKDLKKKEADHEKAQEGETEGQSGGSGTSTEGTN